MPQTPHHVLALLFRCLLSKSALSNLLQCQVSLRKTDRKYRARGNWVIFQAACNSDVTYTWSHKTVYASMQRTALFQRGVHLSQSVTKATRDAVQQAKEDGPQHGLCSAWEWTERMKKPQRNRQKMVSLHQQAVSVKQ